MRKDELIKMWGDPKNWRGGALYYYCAEDPRVIVPKRTTWGGWTVNFAHPMAWPAIAASVVIAVGPVLALLALGVRDLMWIIGAVSVSIAVLIAGSYQMSGRTHPEALPKIVLAVLAVMLPSLWACRSGLPWVPAAIFFLVIAIAFVRRRKA